MRSFVLASCLCALRGTVLGLTAWHRHDVDGFGTESQVLTEASEGSLDTTYDLYNLSVPVDHFHDEAQYEPHSNDTFSLRYWLDTSYYQPGGPVILLIGGEDNGEGWAGNLQHGIADMLAAATNGVKVLLEHRYYGESMPKPNRSVENLRFLTTQQALADIAFFARHVRFPGLEHEDLSPSRAPWIAYGGSYAGGLAAFLRKLYPDVFWGAIASSAVTVAIVDYWKYLEAVRLHGPPACINNTQMLIHAVDNILIKHNGTKYVDQLKGLFGLQNLTHSDDFANALTRRGVGSWQSTNWDYVHFRNNFFQYCDNITSDELRDPELEKNRKVAEELLQVAGYASELPRLATALLNFGHAVRPKEDMSQMATQDELYGHHGAEKWTRENDGRSWAYQVCTQWGYFTTGTGVPSTQLPLVSRLVDMEYAMLRCRLGFNITTEPDVASINQYGGFNISAPRLAFVDGDADPWLYATPHAPEAPERNSTTSQPFILMKGAVHHWDENCAFGNETAPDLPPPMVRETQAEEVRFVKAWIEEWKAEKSREKEDGWKLVHSGEEMSQQPL